MLLLFLVQEYARGILVIVALYFMVDCLSQCFLRFLKVLKDI